MTPRRLLLPMACALPLLILLLSVPSAAISRPAAPGTAELVPEARARLAQAAGDSLLAPWQRELMLRLARTGTTAGLGSSAADLRAARPSRASDVEDGAWSQPLGLARGGHSAIYDPVRDRVVVFGGSSSDSPYYLNDVWALSLVGTPTWTQLTPAGTPPSGRYGHSAIYDPVRDRMMVFDGYYYDYHDGSSHYLDDVWALSLADTPAWTQLTSSGTPPSGRCGHSTTYDPVRDRVVMFAGYSADSPYYLNDVWALSLVDTPTWTQLTPLGTPPSARSSHSAVYDPVRDRTVVFGGSSSDSPHSLNDVWALSLAGTPAWTQLTPSGTSPSARSSHSAVYDPVRDRMLVFGGYWYDGSSHYLNDVWDLSLSGTLAWTQLTPLGTPPSGRDGHIAVYDPVRDRMVVFGGWSGEPLLNDFWALSLTAAPAWTQLTPSGTPPGARSDHSAIYDPVRDRMVVFGGALGSYFNDVWTLSLEGTLVWTQLTPSGTPPRARSAHSAIYDPVRDRMVVFGGRNSSSVYFNDVWALSLAGASAWTQLTPSGTPPSPRGNHSAIYDPVRDRMVVFGGYYVNDVWVLSLAGAPAWTQLTPSGTPPSERDGHGAIYDPVRDRMVVFGGRGSHSIYFNDVWALSLAGASAWTQLTPSGTPPSARVNFSAIYDPVRDRMVAFGGFGLSSPYDLNEVWALSLAGTPAWAQLAPSGTPPSVRNGHSAIYDSVRDRMVVFGSNWGARDLWALEWFHADAVGEPPASLPISGLRPPAPNPTRGPMTVSFSLAQEGRVRLGVYDVSGRLVRWLVDGERRAGTGTVVWDGTAESGIRLGAGVYFVRLAGPGLRETRRVILLR